MELKVGDNRNFSFSDKTYEIKEILEPTEIEISVVWDSGICPHCKEKITKTITHKFSKIEILVDNSIEIPTKSDLIILGYANDNRLLRIYEDNFDKILIYSSLYKDLL